MKVRVIRAGAVLAIGVLVALALANCGEVTCSQRVNTSPGTEGVGQVSIVTDHSVYAPGDTIQATITNHLSTSIIVNNDDFTSLCPYFVVQLRVGNDWQDIHECSRTGGGDAAPPGNAQKQIAAGASFSSIVGISADVGTYRLRTAPYRIDDPIKSGSGTAESATFRVCVCGVCA